MKHAVVITFPAVIQMVMEVDENDQVIVTQSVVMPDQYLDLTAAQHADSNDAHAAVVAIAWASENDWPKLTLTADGVIYPKELID